VIDKKQRLITLITIGLGLLTGCNNETTTQNTSTSISEVQPLAKQNNIYASANIGNSNILFGGENGLSITNTSSSENLEKVSNTFKLPTFESANELLKKTDGKEFYKSNENNSTKSEKSRIYSILNVDDGILVGGSFSTVNGIKKYNLVKLNLDGTLNEAFKSDVAYSNTN
jgi:hypothetical protein